MVKKSKVKLVLKIILWILIVIILIPVIGFFILCFIDPNPYRPNKIDNPNGYVQAVGTNLYDGEGNILRLEGVNLGDWFVQEAWMASATVGDYDTRLYTQKRALEAMADNPNLTAEQIDAVEKLYIDNFITEDDFKTIADLGMNTVRINFSYLNITTDGETIKENGFEKLDWAIEMCNKYNLYCVVDLHGAIGSQNQDIHSGDDSQWALYTTPEYREKTINLWKTIATHFKDEKIIAGYDLLNEPRRAPGKYAGKINFDYYDELYDAVRSVDPNHMIFMECFTFPIHGVNPRTYGWENVCYEYHIYNQTTLSQETTLYFYKALHNLMDYDVPVYIGEFNAWDDLGDWQATLDFFEKLGWSYSSWTYKTNKYMYDIISANKTRGSWGIFELNLEPVDLSTATYEEIVNTYSQVGTENAEPSYLYSFYKNYFANRK